MNVGLTGALPRVRSWMFVPGDSERFLGKLPSLELDVALIDLEDGVAPARKAIGRELAGQVLGRPSPRTTLFVRVNDARSGHLADDLEAVVRPGLVGVCLPKVESARDVLDLAANLGRLEAEHGVDPGSVRILAAVESACGVMNAAEIAGAHERVVGLLLGAEDLALDLGLPPVRLAEARDLLHVRSQIVIAARSQGRFAIDGVYPDYQDLEGLTEDANRARRLGFAGKSLFHPLQLNEINRVFSPTPAEIEQARRMVDAFEQAVAQGAGAVAVDGQLVDLPIVMRARRTLLLADQTVAS